MFVAGFMLGFILAAGLSLIWVKLLKAPTGFPQIIEKEINLGEQKENLSRLAEEIEGLHSQMLRMEEVLTNDNMVLFPARPAKAEKKEDVVVPLVNLSAEESSGMITVKSSRKRQKRSEVVNLYESGCKVKEIARETGLGQGEVELILSLRNKTERFELERIGKR